MSTRSIGDLKNSDGHTSLDDPIASVAPHADVRKAGPPPGTNELSDLGQKIFLDRYAMKDMHKRTLGVGDMVIVCVDDKSGQREVATVRTIDGPRVSLELRDGTLVERLIEHIAKPIETDPEQMMERVARGIAAVEGEQADEWYHNFRWLLNGWKFVPAGRILTAAGTDQQLTFYNCYVVPSPKDSRRGIVDTLSQMMEIMSRGGGVGINVSSLRPRHSYVKGVNGRSSGAVSWGALYSFVTGLIEQGGSRRGALMIILNCWHPDVLEFINSKREMGKITNANISVGITDRFMDAVRADTDWDLVFPDVSDADYEAQWDGNLEKWLAAGKKVVAHKTVKARAIWDSIIESAWASAEPGVFFIERANRMSNSWYYDSGYLGCTNPCVTGDTLIYTDKGLVRARELYEEGESVGVVLDERFGYPQITSAASHVFRTGKKKVYRLDTREGYYLRATADHKIMTARGWVALKDLQPGDRVHVLNRKGGFGTEGSLDLGRTLGWLIGDGTIKQDRAVLSFFGDEKQALAPAFAEQVNRLVSPLTVGRREYEVGVINVSGRDEARVQSGRLLSMVRDHGLVDEKHRVPEVVFKGTEEMQRGFLQALFTADGCFQDGRQKGGSLRLASSRIELLEGVQQLLLNFGIASRIYRNRRLPGFGDLPDGRGGLKSYWCNAQHELVITRQNLNLFARELGFLMPYKQCALKDYISRGKRGPCAEHFTARVESVTEEGVEDVFDLTEPVTHSFIGNGMVVHNCGEQPLPGFGVCNLGAINLSKFVRDGEVDWETLGRSVRYAVRFLDNVIDATPYFFDENYAQQKSERRVGLNTMGLAEMLIRLGIRYGSDESVEFIDRLYSFIATESYRASADIAAEKGSFPLFDAEKYLESGYMKSMPEEVRQVVREKGSRNVTLLTQAPNGCVTPDTLVFADGALRSIASLGDPDGEQWQDVSFNTHSETGAKSANKFYVNGYKEVVEIRTARGFNLAATLQHRVRVIDGEGNYEWRQMGEIQPGDVLVMARGGLGQAKMPRLEAVSTMRRRSGLMLPEALTPELAELLGFYIGDGYLKDRRGLGIAVDARDEDVVGRLREMIGRIFNLDAKVEDTGRNCLLVWASSYFIPRWIRANGLAKSSALDAQIPEAVLAGGAATVSAFLRGLFESDGSISNGIVTLVSGSERLAGEVQIALLGLGIASTRRGLEPGEGRYGSSMRHEVRLLNSAEVLRFRESIGFASRRKQGLLNSCEYRGSRADNIPASLLRRLYIESEGMPTGVRQEIASALKSGMTQERWRDLKSASPSLGNLPSANLLNGHLFFDEAANISLGHSLTFDLSVPDTNTYIANGIVAHNTIGTMVGTSTGIEPFYFWSYYRKSRLGKHEERVGVLEEWQRAHPDKALPDYFVTAMDLAPEEHVKVQAVIQRWVDSSISKTCNLPASYSVEQTRKIYEMLYRLGCKGGTIYRDGSRDVQVLNLKEEDKKAAARTEEKKEEGKRPTAETPAHKEALAPSSDMVESSGSLQPKVRPRPYKRRGYTVSKATPSGTAHITMNEDEENQPFEVFVEIGKAGSDIKAMAEAMGRLMSLILRMASPVSPVERIREIVKQITGIGGARSYGFGKRRVLSLPDAVGQALAENYLGVSYGNEDGGQGAEMGVEKVPDGLAKQKTSAIEATSADLCPSCGDAAFVRVEGCQTCYACGYSEC